MKIFLRVLHFLLLVLFLILQLVFIEHLKLYHINFDLILVAVIGITLMDGVLYGMIYGFMGGLLLDLMVGNIVGLSALIYVVCAFIVSRIIVIGLKRKILTYIFLVFLTTELSLIVSVLFYYLFNYSVNIKEFGLEILINPACNIILVFIIFPLLQAGRLRKDEFGFLYKEKA
jgi:rod shape-determining protein MreD